VEQARAFLAAVAGNTLEALYVVTVAVGFRRGEVLALHWDDIDFDQSTVAIRRSLSKVPGGWAESEPKTPSSRRVVKLPGFACDALRAHRLRQVQQRLAASDWVDPALVFTTARGTHIDGRNLLRLFQAHVRRAGLPSGFTVHSLRHSAATLMLALGIQSKVVQETLGHSRIAVTVDVYSHVLPHLQDEAAAKMDRLLAPG
jgi:integrase